MVETGKTLQQRLWKTFQEIMTVCAANGCKNRLSKGCGKHFFRFPIKNPEYLAKWLAVLRRDKWKPSIYSRLCSDHFTENDYMLRPGASFPYLRLDAVPSIIDGVCIKKEPVKKPPKPIENSPCTSVLPNKPPCGTPAPEVGTADEHSYSVISYKEVAQTSKVDPVLVNLRRKKNTLQKQVLRQRNSIINLKKLIMQQRSNIQGNDPVQLMSKYFKGLTLDMFRHLVQNGKKNKGVQFSKEIKGFAVTLYYYSPVAYELCQPVLSLPDLETLREWMPSVVDLSHSGVVIQTEEAS
ncbi:THAP domain-containing protein 1-like isoform X1 [Aquarana catesbeiana]|uniref:THAP domain-containing protein 1-like isoform X1 n=2 Tax=Aquarana catesbeiana TaxID=8400 RepID=UPI003CC9570F